MFHCCWDWETWPRLLLMGDSLVKTGGLGELCPSEGNTNESVMPAFYMYINYTRTRLIHKFCNCCLFEGVAPRRTSIWTNRNVGEFQLISTTLTKPHLQSDCSFSLFLVFLWRSLLLSRSDPHWASWFWRQQPGSLEHVGWGPHNFSRLKTFFFWQNTRALQGEPFNVSPGGF